MRRGVLMRCWPLRHARRSAVRRAARSIAFATSRHGCWVELICDEALRRCDEDNDNEATPAHPKAHVAAAVTAANAVRPTIVWCRVGTGVVLRLAVALDANNSLTSELQAISRMNGNPPQADEPTRDTAQAPAVRRASCAARCVAIPRMMNWSWLRFQELGVDNLYDALQLRCRVFVLEQGPYLDPDGVDRQAWHLLGRDAAGALTGYLRIVDPGIKYDEPSIGRVITAPEVRGTGGGRVLMAEGTAGCDRHWPGRAMRISAQAHLERFYNHFGFVRVGDNYIEDTIPHVEMLRSAR